MNTRLKQFLAAENISQSQFADTIKVVRASVSHVLAGRNNPGYDFIKAIMNAYPALNMEWLLLGKGKMYKDNVSEAVSTQEIVSPEPSESLLFSYNDEANDQILNSQTVEIPEIPQSNIPLTPKKVSKVIIFFDDGSYQEMGN